MRVPGGSHSRPPPYYPSGAASVVPHRTRVLVYNVKFLPLLGRVLERPLLNTRGFWEIGEVVRTDETRAAIIADLLTRDPRFDVVILCEVFADHARKTFAEAFARRGYHVATCPPVRGFGVFTSSGLFVATRLPILDRAFSPYRTAMGSDRFARKGILHLRLGVRDRALDLFATHLQAGVRARAARRLQLRHARAFIDARTRHSPTIPTLLGGDLNVIGEHSTGHPTEEYVAMREILDGFTDVHHVLTQGRPHPTWNPLENAQMIGDRYGDLERLDYLLVRGDDAERALASDASVEVLRFEHDGLPLSDHYALAFELPLITP